MFDNGAENGKFFDRFKNVLQLQHYYYFCGWLIRFLAILPSLLILIIWGFVIVPILDWIFDD
jgi:hypothetical protein